MEAKSACENFWNFNPIQLIQRFNCFYSIRLEGYEASLKWMTIPNQTILLYKNRIKI